MTLRDMIETLTDLADEHGADVEVRLAQQPRWPFEYSIGEVELVTLREGSVRTEKTPVVFIGEGTQLGYLPTAAAKAMGWSDADADDDDEADDAASVRRGQ